MHKSLVTHRPEKAQHSEHSKKKLLPSEPPVKVEEPVVIPPLPKVDSCGLCLYFFMERSCRRYPPVAGAFPKVAASDWCGEFKAK